MSRGLYQLSYGSSSGKYASILPVWQEKKQGDSGNGRERRTERRSRRGHVRAFPPRVERPPSPVLTPSETPIPRNNHKKFPLLRREGGTSPRERPSAASPAAENPHKETAEETSSGRDGDPAVRPGPATLRLAPGREDVPLANRQPEVPVGFEASSLLLTEPGSIRADGRRRGRIRELQALHAHSRSSGSATRGEFRT